jgi:hypothetical protein
MRILQRPIVRILAVMVAMAGSGIGGVAYASHQFNDVSSGSFFHEEIAAIVDAGCATGFGNEFRPADNATRGQFSFWLNNCGGRVAASTGPDAVFIDSSPIEVDVDSVPLTVGGTGTQIAHLHASVTVFVNNTQSAICSNAPFCGVRFWWEADGLRTNPSAMIYRMDTDRDTDVVSVDAVVTAIGGVTHTYTLVAEGFGLNDEPTGTRIGMQDAQLVATVYPFGGAGEGGVIGPSANSPTQGESGPDASGEG